MDASSLVLMEREDGILNHEVGSYQIETGLEFVYKAYVENNMINVFLTTDRDVNDEEFNLIYDYYNPEYLQKKGYTVEEVEDEYNPVWCITLSLKEEYSEVNSALNDIFAFHEKEMKRVYDIIKAQ